LRMSNFSSLDRRFPVLSTYSSKSAPSSEAL
jgi:hypothetical protein